MSAENPNYTCARCKAAYYEDDGIPCAFCGKAYCLACIGDTVDVCPTCLDQPHPTLDQLEALIAEVRLKDNALEWRAACDEVLEQMRWLYKEGN